MPLIEGPSLGGNARHVLRQYAEENFNARTKALNASGVEEFGGGCLRARYNNLREVVQATPSLVVVPSLTKGGTLFTNLPSSTAADFTVTRATSATRVNSSGLIEVAKTNLALQSGFRTNWNATSADFTAADITLLGNEGRSLSVAVSGNGVDYIRGLRHQTQSLSITSGTTRAVSFYVKKTGTNDTFGFYMRTSTGEEYSAIFNVSANTRATQYSNGLTRVGFSIESLGNDIYRCTDIITATADRTYTSVTFGFITGVNAQTVGMSGEFMGFQFEVGSVATSYIPTTTAAVTRSADEITDTTATALIGQTEGTIYAEVDIRTLGKNSTIFNLFNTANRYIQLSIENTNRLAGAVIDTTSSPTTVVVLRTASGSLTAGTYKLALAYASGDFAFYVNGTQVATSSTGGVIGGYTSIRLGNYNTSLFLNDRIRAATLYDTRLPNTGTLSLQSLTQ